MSSVNGGYYGNVNPAIDVDELVLVGFVTNPLTTTLNCTKDGTPHEIINAGRVSALEVNTDVLDIDPGSLATNIQSAASLQIATGKALRFEADATITALADQRVVAATSQVGTPNETYTYANGQMVYSVQTQSLQVHGQLNVDGIPVAAVPNANVLGYNPATGDIEYQPAGGGGGGGVTNPLSANLQSGNFDILMEEGAVEFLAPTTAPTAYSINGVYNIDAGALPYPVLRFSSSKAGGTQQKSLTLEMDDGKATWASQWEGTLPQEIETRQSIYTVAGQGAAATTNIDCDNVNITPNFASASSVNVTGVVAATGDVTASSILVPGGFSLTTTAQQLAALQSYMTGIFAKLDIVPTATGLIVAPETYSLGDPADSWVPDQSPPEAGGVAAGWRFTKAPGAGGGPKKMNWYPFNPYYPAAPSIGPLPSFNIPKKQLEAVWAVITPTISITTQGVLFFNIFTYDNVNGSSTGFTNRWDYCTNNLALPLTTGGLTLQAGFKYLICCVDADKIVLTPSLPGTITNCNGLYPVQTQTTKLRDPFDIHTDIPHITLTAVALNVTPVPQPADPSTVPVSAIAISTSSSAVAAGLDFTVHRIGFRANNGAVNYEYNLTYV